MSTTFILPLGLTCCLGLLSLHPDIYGQVSLRRSFWGVGAFLLVWQGWLLYRSMATGRAQAVRVRVVRAHYVQALVQLGIYLYWGWYWRPVYDQVELILAQVLFAYVFDMLLCWSRRDEWSLGFGPLPIVLSTNLFLWFKADWFAWQFAMIAVGQMGKECFRWRKDGRSAHIFNPSGFSLTVFSLALLATDSTQLTWGEEIARTLFEPKFIYVWIFLLGLVVQSLFSVTLTTLSAVVVLYLLNTAYFHLTGVYYFLNANIPVAVFLGLHLLVTDPSTSPRTGAGRVLFGGLYGAGVFALYGVLEWLQVPTFYDKLLCVPCLNLLVQSFDRWGAHWAQSLRHFVDLDGPVLRRNRVHMGIWVVFFASLYSTHFVGKEHAGQEISFWRQACTSGLRHGCRDLMALLANQCDQGRDAACDELTLIAEQRTADWRQACSAGSRHGCQMLTTLLAVSCGQGRGAACNQLGLILDAGNIVQSDPELAAGYFLQACENGFDDGCTSMVIADLFRPGSQLTDAARAMAYKKVEALCTRKNELACYLIGHAYVSGQGLQQDIARGLEYFQWACDLGSADGCKELARIFVAGEHVPADRARAVVAFLQACEIGDAPSCAMAGFFYYNGNGVPRDQQRGMAMIQRACDLGFDEACARIARLNP